MIWFLLVSSFILHPSSVVRADGGTLRLSRRQGGYWITIFTAPMPLRAGPVDVSVLVQDGQTREPLPQAQVTVRMTQPGQQALACPATTEAATNKLLRAAPFELPAPGRWELEVQVEGVHGSAVMGCQLEAAHALPRWMQIWPWIGWPALVVALFSVHQVLARRRPLVSPVINRAERLRVK
ncbi:MAG TPA: hypothetical protein VKU02_11270 [Gemmataceae bacterium]|nr:hypothetical protein [Gemmataceae bacterium]